MNNFPGFAAEASVYKAWQFYRGSAGVAGGQAMGAVVPSQDCCTTVTVCGLIVGQCTKTISPGVCQDHFFCQDGSDSGPSGGWYWCGWFSGGPHFAGCAQF